MAVTDHVDFETFINDVKRRDATHTDVTAGDIGVDA